MTDVNSAEFWHSRYQAGRTGWDIGHAHPVFARIATQQTFPPGDMIVLGAGRGHDARLFASHHFNVTAIDFAAAAVREMQSRNSATVAVEAIQADIFALPDRFTNAFDYVLEYTCFCAIDPTRRPEYADVVARLLKPGGSLIAIVFPIWQRPGGPPFAVTPKTLSNLLTKRGLTLQHQEKQPTDSLPARREFETLMVFRK